MGRRFFFAFFFFDFLVFPFFILSLLFLAFFIRPFEGDVPGFRSGPRMSFLPLDAKCLTRSSITADPLSPLALLEAAGFDFARRRQLVSVTRRLQPAIQYGSLP